MQKKVLAEKMREQAEKLLKLLPLLSSPENLNLSVKEIENTLHESEQLIRILSAYKFVSEQKEQFSDLNVHLKIMENINKQEEVRTVTEIADPDSSQEEKTVKPEPAVITAAKPEPVTAKKPEPQKISSEHKEEKTGESKVIMRKKVEFGINDKYRMINELFHQSASEFSAALDQLNLTETPEDAENYLENLKNLYSWKPEHPLVKMIYSLTQKRFQ
ncbi:MAG: hypothetical protein K0S33_2640 [Bacteroidetes bacterium]|jgi:hypothetical protein|nr:hypothetical protein [Bacteroidota bacterium]